MLLKSFVKNQRSIVFVALMSFFILESLVVVATGFMKDTNTKNYLGITTPDFKTHLDIANSHLSDISKIFYDTDIDTEFVKNIMFEAVQTTDKEKLSKLRLKLLSHLQKTYTYMKKYNVRQLHFHLPKAVSFLRFHRPNKFGDSLVGVRETLEYVNKNKTPVSSFEEGRIFNGFRNVFPIYKDDVFVGTVEISFSFSAMQTLLSKMDSSSYLFMIKNSVVDKKVFDHERSNYKKSEFKGWDYDKNTLKDNTQIGLKEIHIINEAIKTQVAPKLKNGELFSIYYRSEQLYENRSIVVSFSPISNIDNKTVAYAISYRFGDFLDIIFGNIKILFSVLSLLALLLSAIFTIALMGAHKKQEELHKLATHDALTKILNRHGANELIDQKIKEFKRNHEKMSVVFFDIDLFKRINDTYGHDMGDYVLENIAKIVNSEIRQSDIFARWGGEEFIVFLPHTDISDAIGVAEKLRKSIQRYAFSTVDSVSCSFGVTELRDGDDKNSILHRVDALLYKAKKAGRNCVVDDSKP